MSNEENSRSLSALWKQHIRSWQKTQLSQSAYCRENDLNYHRFTYWRRKFDNLANPALHPIQRSGFVPVKPSSSPGPQSLTATLPNGVLLQGINTSNLPVVKQLLGLLP